MPLWAYDSLWDRPNQCFQSRVQTCSNISRRPAGSAAVMASSMIVCNCRMCGSGLPESFQLNDFGPHCEMLACGYWNLYRTFFVLLNVFELGCCFDEAQLYTSQEWWRLVPMWRIPWSLSRSSEQTVTEVSAVPLNLGSLNIGAHHGSVIGCHPRWVLCTLVKFSQVLQWSLPGKQQALASTLGLSASRGSRSWFTVDSVW